MKFVTDGMLGKLTRWLRLSGYDVVYIGNLSVPEKDQDEVLLDLARREKRVLLTKDLSLYRSARKAGIKTVPIKTGDVTSQLVEISKKLGHRIKIDPENSRCTACNGVLRSVNREAVVGLVPDSVLKSGKKFWRCSKCGKIYWEGKHWKTIIETISRYNELREQTC